MGTEEADLLLAQQYLPNSALISVNRLLIIEWLLPTDRRTGEELLQWAEHQRPNWARLIQCNNKAEVFAALAEVQAETAIRAGSYVPIVHFETHGSEDGLQGVGPDGTEFLRWEELNTPLQALNAATKCNLVIFFAACEGYAGVKTFNQGPCAPAVAIVGPSAQVNPGELLRITKEFYRRLIDDSPDMTDMVESATRESDECLIEYEPFSYLAFESCVQMLREKLNSDLPLIGVLSSSSSEGRRLAAAHVQQIWDTMFLIDKHPENEARFGVNWADVVESL
ncbi:MAG: hypothetical protein HRT92_03190 [Piscirickettsiaceae bacterium]|nr:hypothetical protein [Piscirickettsiaceae bacterium]